MLVFSCRQIGVLLVATALLPAPALAVPAKGQKIMVAWPSPYAVEIARETHLKGGNVVDVAVAVALSLAVTHPYYASFGGGGFALVKMGKEVKVLDFREVAPKKAGPDLYKSKEEKASLDGGLAVAVPGVPAGLWELHKKHGKLKWRDLFPGALALAEKGFRVSGEWASLTARNEDRFNEPAKKIFFSKKGVPLVPGDLLKQPKLAKLLREMRQGGAQVFYSGASAKDLVATANANGGILDVDDLKSYRVRWLEPLVADYAGHKLYLMPPPSSGGVVIAQAVKLMEKTGLASKAPLSVEELHLLAEIMKLSYRGRSLLGDPDFTKNPVAQLLDDKYIAQMASLIKPDKAIDVGPLKEVVFEKASTTHFSVMDAEGNSVAFTVTINGDWGSGLVTDRYGIALNNEMDDFTTRPGEPNLFGLVQGEGNQVRAGARPLSSMSPTIVEKDGRTVLSLGAPGGPRIITGVLQVVHRSLTQPFDIDQAIQAPRVHHQFLPNKVVTDELRLPPETIAALKAKGHVMDTGSTAKVYGIRRAEDGILSGAADQRGEGAAGGL